MFVCETDNLLTQESTLTTGNKFCDPKNIFNPNNIKKYYLNQTININTQTKRFEDTLFNKYNFLSPDCTINQEEIDYISAEEIFGNNYLVFEDRIELDDVKNSNTSNNYFLSVLTSITQFPTLIYNLFRTREVNNIGYYEVILFVEGEWQIVVLDSFFPVKKGTQNLIFTKPNNNELWVLLLEKAWSKVNKGYLSKTTTSDVFLALTGFNCETINNKSNKQDLWEKIRNNKHNLICTGTNLNSVKLLDSYGIKADSSYLIMSAEEAVVEGENIRLLKLRNPWRGKSWNGAWSEGCHRWSDEAKKAFKITQNNNNSHYFYMDFDNFCFYFTSTCICYFQSNSYFKSFELLKENYNKEAPFVYCISVEETVTSALSLFRKGERESISTIASMVIARVEDNCFVEVFGSCSGQNINLIKTLTRGNYVAWIYLDKYLGRKNNYIFRFSSESIFSCKFFGQDVDFSLIKEIIKTGVLQDIRKDQRKEELNKFIKTDFKGTGLGYLLIDNTSTTNSYKVTFNSNGLMNMRLLPPFELAKESFELYCHPESKTIIIGIINQLSLRSTFFIEIKSNLNSSDCPVDYGRQEYLFTKELAGHFDENFENPCYDYYCKDFRAELEIQFDKVKVNEKNFNSLQSEFPLQLAEIQKVRPLSDNTECIWSNIDYFDNGYYLGEVNHNGQKHGRGFYQWNTGEVYIGQWKEGERTGVGKMYNVKGKLIYEGDYENGKKQGKGEMYLDNGDFYKGDFKNDYFNGTGTYVWSDNISWTGSFVEDKFHGVGIFVFSNGKSKLREFKMGELVD